MEMVNHGELGLLAISTGMLCAGRNSPITLLIADSIADLKKIISSIEVFRPTECEHIETEYINGITFLYLPVN